MRLMTGLLAGQDFSTTLTGDSSLQKRPMDRVINPLRDMGAQLSGVGERMTPPVQIQPAKLKGIQFEETLGSAQVKSAVLLAGLYADGSTTVIERKPFRDHTERMLEMFGVPTIQSDEGITVNGEIELQSIQDARIPGDISSAAFFLVAASIIDGSEVVLKNVSLNKTRTGIIDVLLEMGANLEIKEDKSTRGGEPYGDIYVKSAPLKGVCVSKEQVPRLVDELPVLMVAFSCAEGESSIEDVSELRVKETDRVESMMTGLKAMGVDIAVQDEQMVIKGRESLNGDVSIASFDDHRTAMSFIVAGLKAEKPVRIDSIDCISISYPSFLEDLTRLTSEGLSA